jgi:DNA-binding response OmpR family regulator
MGHQRNIGGSSRANTGSGVRAEFLSIGRVAWSVEAQEVRSMSPYRLLLADSRERVPHQLSVTLGEISKQEVEVEVATGGADLLSRILQATYDAVFYWADGEDDLAVAVRLREARPSLPIVILTRPGDAEFGALAEKVGANRVHQAPPSVHLLAEQIFQMIRSGELQHELEEQGSARLSQAGALNTILRETCDLSPKARETRPLIYPRVFAPLLVEDDPEQALLMIRAFRKAEIHVPLPVLTSGEELMAYLAKAERFPKKGETSLPSLLLLDVRLPGKSGLEVLEWIRNESRHPRLAVVMLSASSDPSDVNRAHELGANSYVIKPTEFSALVDLVVGLERYWGMLNEPLHL